VRIAILAVCVIGLYVGIPAGVVGVCVIEPAWTPYVVAFTTVVLIATIGHYRSASGLMLDATGAQRSTPEHEPELYAMLARLASLADIPTPRLAVIATPNTNAFTVGIRRRDATVVVTTGLRNALGAREIEAVLGHELAHVANRDAGVMTLAGVPRTLGETLIGEEGLIFYLWFLIWWLGIPIWALGSLVTLTLSRYREFSADRGSALLTGGPAALMSALVKLDGSDVSIPDEDLRRLSRVEALCVVSNGQARFALFSDHPPLAKRLARLEEMTRGMGKLVGP
jgi:heat shock protein HtpX